MGHQLSKLDIPAGSIGQKIKSKQNIEVLENVSLQSGNILSGSDIGHSRDVYAFGIVVEQVYEYLSSLGQ